MENSPVHVAVDGLRGCAGRLAGTAHRVAAAVAEVPPLVVVDPGWAAPPALAALERAADGWFGVAGAEVAATAGALRAAADGYDDADARAAARLRGVG